MGLSEIIDKQLRLFMKVAHQRDEWRARALAAEEQLRAAVAQEKENR